MPRAVLDSSPVRADSGIPPPTQTRRNLKRSASQASLLTPPRTVKRENKRRTGKRVAGRLPKSKSKSRSHSRGSGTETELEATDNEEDVSLGDGAGRRLDFGPSAKKRRLNDLDARLETLLESFDGEDPENPFWDGPSKANASETAEKADKIDVKKGADKSVRVRSPSPPLLRFRGKAPVSPPPSNRRTTVVETVDEAVVESVVKTTVETIVEPPAKPTIDPPTESTDEPSVEPTDQLPVVELPPMPSTPKKGKKRIVDSPVRDSPNNPFLDDSPSSVIGEPTEPRTPTTRAEKPTITYVFRGVRAQFANPMYNLPPEVHEHSLLPIEHPDYSPDPACPPKLLFTKPRKRQASPSPTRAGRSKTATHSKPAIPSAHSDNEWDDSDDDAELHVTPPKRLFH